MNACYLDEAVCLLCRKSDYMTWELPSCQVYEDRLLYGLVFSNASTLPCMGSPWLALGSQ